MVLFVGVLFMEKYRYIVLIVDFGLFGFCFKELLSNLVVLGFLYVMMMDLFVVIVFSLLSVSVLDMLAFCLFNVVILVFIWILLVVR